MEREKEGLQSLGSQTQYRMDYAPEVLESFVNKHPDNDYWGTPSTVLSLPVYVLLQVNQTLLRFVFHTSQTYEWLREEFEALSF